MGTLFPNGVSSMAICITDGVFKGLAPSVSVWQREMMNENIDIYDANLSHLGVMDRATAHKQGQWHLAFHCWIVNGIDDGSLLFQLRSRTSVNFASLLDASAAGHLDAGERVGDGGVREIFEELGIEVELSSLHELGYRVEAMDESNGDKNREYQSVYLVRLDRPVSEYRPSPDEVDGLFWLPISSGFELFSGVMKEARVQGIVYDHETRQWYPNTRTVTLKDFIPRIQRYYLTVCIMAERLVRGQFPLAIS